MSDVMVVDSTANAWTPADESDFTCSRCGLHNPSPLHRTDCWLTVRICTEHGHPDHDHAGTYMSVEAIIDDPAAWLRMREGGE